VAARAWTERATSRRGPLARHRCGDRGHDRGPETPPASGLARTHHVLADIR